jgi:hypothetical protein
MAVKGAKCYRPNFSPLSSTFNEMPEVVIS